MHAKLDEFVFGEMAAQLVVDGVVDRKVVGGEQVGEVQRDAFGVPRLIRSPWPKSTTGTSANADDGAMRVMVVSLA